MKRRRFQHLLLITLVMGILLAVGFERCLWLQKRREALSRQLMTALEVDDVQRARRLVEAGADPNAPITPLPPPSFKQWWKHLLYHTALPVNDSPTAILIACGLDTSPFAHSPWVCPDSPELVQTMFRHGADIHAGDQYGWTPLHYAAQSGHLQTVRILIEYGADVNAKARFGDTPLMIVSHQDPNLIRLLLEHGADVNAANGAPLACAIHDKRTSPEVVHLLLEHGANPYRVTRDGKTALWAARYEKRPDLIAVLQQAGAKR